jgi:hypothetical protein
MALSDEDKRWLLEHFATKPALEPLATREDVEQAETRLLTAFHSWASPAEARQRGHSEILHALALEVTDLRDRVKKLESGARSKFISP